MVKKVLASNYILDANELLLLVVGVSIVHVHVHVQCICIAAIPDKLL